MTARAIAAFALAIGLLALLQEACAQAPTSGRPLGDILMNLKNKTFDDVKMEADEQATKQPKYKSTPDLTHSIRSNHNDTHERAFVMTHVSHCRSAILASLPGLLVGILVLPGLLTSAEPEKKLDPEVVKKRVFRSWREVVRTEAGRKHQDSTDLFCYRFQPKQPEIWLFAGELSPGPMSQELLLDVTSVPMRLDSMSRDRRGVQNFALGIIKFDGNCLIWVTSPRPNGDRPKEFTSTKENGYLLHVLKPCEYLDQVSTVKD